MRHHHKRLPRVVSARRPCRVHRRRRAERTRGSARVVALRVGELCWTLRVLCVVLWMGDGVLCLHVRRLAWGLRRRVVVLVLGTAWWSTTRMLHQASVLADRG